MAHLKDKLLALKAKADKKHGKDIDDLVALAEAVELEAKAQAERAAIEEQAAKVLRQKYEPKMPRIFSLQFLRLVG